MKYPPRDLLVLLRMPAGRRKIRRRLRRSLWPAISRLTAGYRRFIVRRPRVIAVVGSFGKTTTAAAVSVALGLPTKSGGNSFSSIARGVRHMRPSDRHAVFEVGIAKPGEMRPYARLLRPNIAVVTSIGSEHHRSFHSLEATREEKAEMVRALPETGTAILNGDDDNVRWMAGQTRARVITYGFAHGTDVRATDLELVWPVGSRFTVEAGGDRLPVTTRLIGWPMVYPILAAIAVAFAEGCALDEAVSRLALLPPTPSRLELLPLENGAFLLRDEYKSALETIDAALDVLTGIPARRRLVVLGEITEPPGSQNPLYRRLGARVAEIADHAIFIGDTARHYATGARQAGMGNDRLVAAGKSLRKAAAVLRDELGPGDVVLVKGRNTQKLERIVLTLEGRNVACDIPTCNFRVSCDRCSMLERGWEGTRVVT